MLNIDIRRRDTARVIAEDPWDVTVYTVDRPTGVETETKFVGRLFPVRTGFSQDLRSGLRLEGESPSSRNHWLLMTAWDTPECKAEATVVAVHRQSQLTHKLRVITTTLYSYKQEVTLDEL